MSNQPATEAEAPRVREHLFDPCSLPPRLQLLTGILVAEVIAGAATMSGVIECCGVVPLGDVAQVPTAAYAIVCVSLLFGLLLISTGLAVTRPRAAFLLVAAACVFFATVLLGYFSGEFLRSGATSIATLLLWFALVTAVSAIRRRSKSVERRWWPLIYVGLGIVVGVWAQRRAEPWTLPTLLVILQQGLVFFYVVAAADWAELSDTVARLATRPNAASGARERPGWMLGATIILAVLLAGLTAALSPPRIFLYAVADVVAIGGVFAVVRIVGVHLDTRARITWPSVAVVAFSMIFGYVAIWHGASRPVVHATYAIITALAVVLAPHSRIGALLGPAALVGLVYALNTLLSVAITPGIQPMMNGNGIFLAGATLALLAALMCAWRWRRGQAIGEPTRIVFAFVASLWLLFLLWAGLYEVLRHAGEQATTWAALVLLVTVLVDMLLLGGSITNHDGRNFPRDARVRLYFGYVLLVLASVVFWGSVRGTQQVHAIAKTYAPDTFLQSGLPGYGVAMLTALAVLRFVQWRGAAQPETSAA